MKSWSNLKVDRERLADFCLGDNSWYTLWIPQSELVLTNFADAMRQQKIMIQLLVEYTDRFYHGLKAAYEGEFYDIIPLTEDSGSIIKLYQFEIENNDAGLGYKAKLEALSDLVASGELGQVSKWNASNMVAISFGQHLYYPLLSPIKDAALPLNMRPLAISEPSEVRFVDDLMAFYDSKPGQDKLRGYSLYLLRNADDRAKGLGFALAGNFYPDFLLWLVDDKTGKQWLSFIDPKGILNLNISDPKFGLYREIKQIEKQLGDAMISLNSFILSVTTFNKLLNVAGTASKSDLEIRNVLFMDDGGQEYLGKLFDRVLRESTDL